MSVVVVLCELRLYVNMKKNKKLLMKGNPLT